MAITDSCAAGREMPRTKNQSKNILSYGLPVSTTDRQDINYIVYPDDGTNRTKFLRQTYTKRRDPL